MGSGEFPIGRRMARWRVRRRMSQQVFADRLGKSKSWVDKVERGVRALDRMSVIQEVAGVLRIDPAVLLGEDTPARPAAAPLVAEVDDTRAALTRYAVFATDGVDRPEVPAAEVGRQVEHAWLTYQHAGYPQVLRMLPRLLDVTRRLPANEPTRSALRVQAYRIAASALVKLGDAEGAWLAADRAVAVAGDDPVLAATAVVSLGEVLRAAGRGRLAVATAVAAAHRIAPTVPGQGPPDVLAVCGSLLLQAALAAAGRGDPRGVEELIGQATEIAVRLGDGEDHHQLAFGPTVVALARVAAAVELGEPTEAVRGHEQVTGQAPWRRLPPEHRAAHLLDVTRAYLDLGDPARAGRTLVEADRTAPAEVRCRPVGRTLLTRVAGDGPTVAGVARLATLVDLTP
ncbi:XRE family transcriptional regulator [Micromonospora fluostatini]|uniref:XRE family transcriptional regulator n=1 Tax=Micromonospora fluostatini TaxID=1629071 RepID=A0ABY2DHG5_9ACTN|nr:XRE family transcriptional regulator [Micromonospora fluostatini]